jgi:chromosomal replication initiator protein
VQWQEVLNEVSKHIPPVYYEPFITPLSIHSINGEKLILSAPSEVIKNHVKKKYQHHLEQAIIKLSGKSYEIEILVDFPTSLPINNFVEERFKDHSNLQTEFQFENFLVGDSNRLAVEAGQEIIKNPGRYNPIYFYGSVGVGKTHLAQAIGQGLEKTYSHYKVKYTTISNFLSEFVYTIQNKQSVENFRLKYQSFDAIIIDDIQFLNSSAEKTQEEFYNLFNHFYERKKQIVIIADRPIAELPLQDRLKSRFMIGHQIEIRPPDSEIRLQLLKMKEHSLGLSLSEKALQFISEAFKSDMRTLLGSLNELSLYKKTYRLLILNDEKVIEILQARLQNLSQESIIPEKIIETVSEYYGQEKTDVLSKSRRAEYILPRHVSMYLLHEVAKLSKSQIGKIFSTNHTTVIAAVRKVKDKLKKDSHFLLTIENFRKKFEFQ